jgi:hypothetical protein
MTSLGRIGDLRSALTLIEFLRGDEMKLKTAARKALTVLFRVATGKATDFGYSPGRWETHYYHVIDRRGVEVPETEPEKKKKGD